jgi:hypothetical protein
MSLGVARASHGAFDPTAAPLVAIWRDARRSRVLPSRARIDSALALVGYSRVALDSARRAVRLEPGTSLDFGGIAKGYIIGEAKRTLARAGVTSILIEAGGDIVTGSAPPGLRGWTISAPRATSRLRVDLLRANDRAVSTSGPETQNVLIDSVRYSHVVDPRTGMALTNDVLATAVGRDPAMTDAVATAATVLGPDSLFLVAHLVDEVEVRVAPLVWLSRPIFIDGPRQRRRDTLSSHDEIAAKANVPGRRANQHAERARLHDPAQVSIQHAQLIRAEREPYVLFLARRQGHAREPLQLHHRPRD